MLRRICSAVAKQLSTEGSVLILKYDVPALFNL